jgi:hypothetical protein
MLEQVLSVVVVLGVGVLGFILRGYFVSYASEKGKNLATKEDVAQITSLFGNFFWPISGGLIWPTLGRCRLGKAFA